MHGVIVEAHIVIVDQPNSILIVWLVVAEEEPLENGFMHLLSIQQLPAVGY